MASKVINSILNLKDNFSNTINKVTNNTKQFQRQVKLAEKQARDMRNGISNAFSGTAAKIAGTLGVIGLGEFAKSSLMLASDLNEVQNVVDTTFGGMADKINEFAKTTSSKFGVSELQAKKYSGVLGAIMKSSGIASDKLADMSTSLSGLAGDMASFYNLEPDEAFEKLKSAIGGETEPMKALGVNMSVANMEAFALTQGINKQWKEMSQSEQTILRYQYLMKNTADAQGDYAKTSSGFANQLRTLKLNFQTLGANIMSYAIPPLQNLFGKINNIVTKIDVKDFVDKVTPKLKIFGDVFTWIGNNADWIIPILGGVLSGFLAFMSIGKVIVIFNAVKKAIAGFSLLANPITLVAVGIGIFVGACIYAYKHSEKFREIVNQLWDKIKGFGSYLADVIPPILESMGQLFKEKILPVLKQVGDWILDNVVPALQKFGDFFMTSILPILKQFGNFILTYIAPALVKFGQFFISTIIPSLEKLEEKILDLWINKLLPFFTWLSSILQPLLNALLPALGIILGDVLSGIGNVVNGIITTFGGVIDFVTGVFTGNWLQAWNGVKEIFKGIFEQLEGIVKVPLNAVIRLINSAIQSINNSIQFDVPSWIPGIGGQHIGANISQIPQFANGTQYFTGGQAIVGEHGAELIDLPKGSKVRTASQTKTALSKNVGDIYVTIQGNVIGNEEFANYVGQHVWNQVSLGLMNT